MNDTTDLRTGSSNSNPSRATIDESGAGPGILTDPAAPAPDRKSGRRDLRTLFIVCSFGLALMLLIALNMK